MPKRMVDTSPINSRFRYFFDKTSILFALGLELKVDAD